MYNIGTDIIEISRIQEAVNHGGERFLHRVYTDYEIRQCRKKPSSLAARFAGKEAVIKALGTANKVIQWREIEILSEHNGKPSVNLYGKAQNQAKNLGLDRLEISLSHSKEYAVAFVSGITE